jgi:hypothetical protein
MHGMIEQQQRGRMAGTDSEKGRTDRHGDRKVVGGQII